MLYVHICPLFTISLYVHAGWGGASQALRYRLLSDICGRVGRNADNFDAVQRARPFENPAECIRGTIPTGFLRTDVFDVSVTLCFASQYFPFNFDNIF